MSFKNSRIEKAFPVINFSRRAGYDWNKLMNEKTLKRHKWLSETWTNLYFTHQEDEFIRSLSTEDIMKTRWFEKYGIKEPNF